MGWHIPGLGVFKSTKVNGEHTPHVIIDNAELNVDVDASTLASSAHQVTQNTALTAVNASLDAIEADADAINTATGAQADAEATGNGSVIAILKRIRTLLGLNPQTTLASLGIEAKTIGTSSVQLTSIANGAKHALISFVGTEGDYVRFRMDGSAVTSTTGQKIKVGDYLDLTDPFGNYATILSNLRFIRDTAASADVVAHVEYFD